MHYIKTMETLKKVGKKILRTQIQILEEKNRLLLLWLCLVIKSQGSLKIKSEN